MKAAASIHGAESKIYGEAFAKKPILRVVYGGFYEMIGRALAPESAGGTVEIGSGSGNIKDTLPSCVTTDIFPGPGIDRTENVYQLSFRDGSVDNFVLVDVLHHLRYPGAAFRELSRALRPGGRVALLEPCMSALGLLVYGCFHHEPLGMNELIEWLPPKDWNPGEESYYAAQGMAFRLFVLGQLPEGLPQLRVVTSRRLSALSYVLSGGFRQRQLYPTSWYTAIRTLEGPLDFMPSVFATRLMVVLEKDG